MSAQAASGTITITGEVSDVTCPITPGGGGGTAGDINVQLPKALKGDLAASGATTGQKAFDIQIGATGSGGCGSAPLKLTFGGVNVDTDGLLKNTVVGGTDAKVELLHDGVPLNLTNAEIPDIVAETAPVTLKMAAQYRAANAGVTEGELSTSVDLNLEVQ